MATDRWIAPIVMWWLSLGLYLVLAGQSSLDEVIAGALAAASVVLLTVLTWRVADHSFRFRRIAWLRLLTDTGRALALDTARVLVALLTPQPPSGRFVHEPEPLQGSDAERAAQRALLVLSRSMAPNAYVIWSLGRDHKLSLHRLVDAQE